MMAETKEHPIRLETLSQGKRKCTAIGSILIVAFFTLVGMMGPSRLTTKAPSNGSGTGIQLTSDKFISSPRNVCFADVNRQQFQTPVPYCWQHYFTFHNRYSNFFKLEMVPHRTAETRMYERLEHTIPMYFELYGFAPDTDEPQHISDGVVNRRIVCRGSNDACDITTLVTASHIVYSKYWFLVYIPQESILEAQFINTTDILFSYENRNYAALSMSIKYIFMCFSFFIVYSSWCYNCHRFRKTTEKGGSTLSKLFPSNTMEQKWVTAILLGSIAYAYPLTFMEYSPSPGFRRFGEVGAIICQFTFLCILLMYWLVSFDALVNEPPFNRRTFWYPKIIYCTIGWLVGVSIYAWITVKSINDPLYDWSMDKSYYYLLKAYVYMFGISYLLWVAFVIAKGAVELQHMQSKHVFIYFEHLWRLVATVIGLVAGLILDMDVHNSTHMMFYQALFAFYAWELVYLHTPVSAVSDSMGIMENQDNGVLGIVTQPQLPNDPMVVPMVNMAAKKDNPANSSGQPKPTDVMEVTLAEV